MRRDSGTTPDLPAATASVPPALRALLAETVDYAGSFPPANLPLVTALENYAAYARSDWRWMLARFVCPVSRLPDLAPTIADAAPAEPLRFSLLPARADTTDACLEGLEAELRTVRTFALEQASVVALEQMEMRVPDQTVASGRLEHLASSLLGKLDDAGLGALEVYLELPPGDQLGAAVALAPVLREAGGGLKIRTGGERPAEIPSARYIAHFITACRDAGVSFKATAGLHHPVRQLEPTHGAPVHGFLNLFTASVLADVHDLEPGRTADILEDDDPAHFLFDEDGLSWTALGATVAEVERVRRSLARSFGSCSFAEPAVHLRTLSLA